MKTITALLVVAAFLLCLVAATPAIAQEKIKAATIDDLPRHTYEVTAKPSVILTSDEEFAKLAAEVRAHVLADLAAYDIKDKTTLQRYYNVLQIVYFLEGDHATAFSYLEKSRALEEKEAQKYMMGLAGLTYVDALAIEKDPQSDAFGAAYREALATRIDAMPWDTVQEMIQMFHGQMQIVSENILMGVVQGQLDPAVEKTGHLSGDQASQLIGFRSALVYIIPYKDQFAAVLGEAIAAHKVEKKNIWVERDFAFKGDEDYQPVVVGIWDSGVDVNVFTGHLFINVKEKGDNNDTDGNGFADDINGIAFDLQSNPTPDLLYTLGDREPDRKELEDRIKGFTDITASVESPEASEVREAMSGLEPEEVKAFVEGLTLYAYHSHGTHVAGIAAEGNPYARVLAARLTFDHHMIPEPYTDELMARFGQSCRQSIEYFKAHDVRAVNMSWGLGLREIEHNLEANGIGKDGKERGEMARKMFEVFKRDLYEAIEGARGILFVASAGNSDNDVEFDLFAPSGFDLPNLLIVGAVDQAGEPTTFTSFGSTVVVYGNGFEVESYVPGGRKIKMSGTSMSAPNVTNLAAKLVARDPALNPIDVKELIIGGSNDMGDGDRPMLVINPKKSMELLEEKLAAK
jgi:hypothetical protein